MKSRLFSASRWRTTLYWERGTDRQVEKRLAHRSGSWGMRGVMFGLPGPGPGRGGRGAIRSPLYQRVGNVVKGPPYGTAGDVRTIVPVVGEGKRSGIPRAGL